ncbi:MAG: WD40 repeat domain-containing protein [Bacteroidota bacterium]
MHFIKVHTRQSFVIFILLIFSSINSFADVSWLVRTINTDKAILGLDFSPDNKLIVSGGASREVALWDVSTGSLVKSLKGHTDDIVCVRFDPNGRYIASGSVDKTIIIWDVLSGQIVNRMVGHSDYVRDVNFSPDGRFLVSASWDQTAIIWDVLTGRQVQVLTGHRDNVTSACFSPDGTKIVTACGDHNLRIFEVTNGKLMKTIFGHEDEIWDVKWASDQRFLASGGWDNTARVWNVEEAKEIYKFPGHITDVWAVCFSPDNQVLYTCGGDRKVKAWDLATGELVRDVTGDTHTGDVEEVACSKNGKYLASASRDGSIRIWKAPTLFDRIQIIAESQMRNWNVQQTFEKTADYKKRVSNQAQQYSIFENKAADKIKEMFTKSMDWKKDLELVKYDADTEIYSINSKVLGEFKVNVPIDEAPSLQQNFGKIPIDEVFLFFDWEKGKFKIDAFGITIDGKKKFYRSLQNIATLKK